MLRGIILQIILVSSIFGSGGFDNGTATGKGKFQLDLTWNPFNKFKNGQSYGVFSYGFTDNIDIHGYISKHPEHYITYYSGIFYQFYKSKNADLATAIGIRRRLDANWTDVFLPQLLYTFHINQRIKIGGSIVNVISQDSKISNRFSTDISISYKTKFESATIESISVGVGGFRPATWNPNQLLLPTYSIDIKFK